MTVSKFRPSYTFAEERLEQLKAVVPEAFADGKINWDVLREALGEHLEDEESERFGLFWPGKRQARRLAAMPSKGTLVPVPGEGVNEDVTRNIFIEGENLEVLKLLLKSYAGRVKMIYIDPPYNIDSDQIYIDDYLDPLNEYLRKSGEIGSGEELLTTNPRSDGRFHSRWLSMIYPRILLAHRLLADEGVIFISIDDNEAFHLRQVMNEVFGEENFISQIVWEGGLKNDSRFVSVSHDYIICYTKDRENLRINQRVWRTRKEGIDKIYSKVEELSDTYGSDYEAMNRELRNWYRSLNKNDPAWQHRHYNSIDERGVFFPGDISWPGGGGPDYDVIHPVSGKPVKKPARGWVFPNLERMMEAIAEGRVYFGPDERSVPNLKRYLHETEGQVLPSVIYRDRRGSMKRLRELMGSDIFRNPKDEEILQKLIEATTEGADIILDFFAGSCSSAHATMSQNHEDGQSRSFIMVQLPELVPVDSNASRLGFDNIAEIGKERIRRAIKKLAEEHPEKANTMEGRSILGFKVYKLAQSNFREWRDYEGEDPREYQLRLAEMAQSPLVEGWKPEALLVEIMLQQGFPLDSQVTTSDEFKPNTVHRVQSDFHDFSLYVCLDEQIQTQTAERLMSLPKEDVFICLDSALTDELKMRLDDALNLYVI